MVSLTNGVATVSIGGNGEVKAGALPSSSSIWSPQPVLRPLKAGVTPTTDVPGPSVVTKTNVAIRCPDVGKGSSRLRIVCISDTHTRHHEYASIIPPG
jgi:hypothetical protein